VSYVLVSKEKHGDYYYPAGTDEELAASALQILTERDAEGYWYHDPDKMDAESERYRAEELIWNVLPEGHWPGWDASEELRVAAINNYGKVLKEKYSDDKEVLDLKYKKYKRAVQDYKYRRAYREWYAEMREVVDNKDLSIVTFKSGRKSPRAYEVLSNRADHEYEGVELERLQEVTIV
jgi:hypothetical protein